MFFGQHGGIDAVTAGKNSISDVNGGGLNGNIIDDRHFFSGGKEEVMTQFLSCDHRNIVGFGRNNDREQRFSILYKEQRGFVQSLGAS